MSLKLWFLEKIWNRIKKWIDRWFKREKLEEKNRKAEEEASVKGQAPRYNPDTPPSMRPIRKSGKTARKKNTA